MTEFKITEEAVGTRIDVFITEQTEGLSRSSVQKGIENKEVVVNDKVVKYNYKLRLNDVIKVTVPKPVELNVEAENIELNIVYEDKDLIVINKPKGMVVHPAPGHYTGTLVNALMYHCKGELSGINGVMRPGIVHRIDRDTTGLIVVAKSNEAHIGLSKQLEDHSMNRTYNAIVFNSIKYDEGSIDAPIGRNPSNRKQMAIIERGGKRAVTHYTILERFGKYTLIQLKLETGRTHQIRVHMTYHGNPLLGDEVYGKPRNINYGFTGQALHAKTLGFIHPINGEYMEFDSELPEQFEIALQKMRTLKPTY